MGKHLLETLVHSNDFQIFYVNRGRGYWGNSGRLPFPNTTFYYGNRDHKKEFLKLLNYISNKVGVSSENPWHAVYDFSCYEPKELKCVHLALRNRTKLYVFVSSDSVYDVCEPSNFKGRPVEEVHALRPNDPEKRLKLRKADTYGDVNEFIDFKFHCIGAQVPLFGFFGFNRGFSF